MYSTSRSRLRIVSGSNATKFFDDIGEVGSALDAPLQPQLEETVEQTFINRLARIMSIAALGTHRGSLTDASRECDCNTSPAASLFPRTCEDLLGQLAY